MLSPCDHMICVYMLDLLIELVWRTVRSRYMPFPVQLHHLEGSPFSVCLHQVTVH